MNQFVGPPETAELQPFSTRTLEDEQSEGVTLADIFRALVKSKWLILVCTLTCVVATAIYVTTAKPVYEATASIRIDPSRAGSLGLNDLLSLAGSDSGEKTQTEMAILTSDQVALSTLDSLTAKQFSAYAGFDKGTMNFAPADQQLSRQQENLLASFKGSLTTKQIEGTQLVGIHFRNGNPQLAAAIVNSVIEAYIRGNFDSRYESVNQVRTWLSKQMDELRGRASTAQRKLADFQEQNNLIGTDPSNNTVIDSLKLLNTRLTEAEGDRIVKEAQMRAASTGDPAILASLLPDPKLQALQEQEGNLYAQYIQLSSKFGTAYPPLADVKQQLESVKTQLAQDVSVISSRLKEDYDTANRTESMLRQQYETETGKAFALNRTQADHAVLLAEATSSRDLFDTLQYKLQQASVDAGLNSVNTMIVDKARAPLNPIEPKKGLILAFGLILGAAAGIGSALLRESLSDQIQNLATIERTTGLTSLATVPHIQWLNKADSQIANLVAISEPRSRGAEAYRALRNSLLLSSIDRPARTIVVTSSLPGEGKSSTSANYAVVLAQKGERVLIIDADLRRPSLHTFFGLANTVGLSDAILTEGNNPQIVVPIPELPNLSFLPAGEKVSLPSEALGSNKFRTMLDELENLYDVVILDSAPILSVSDSVPLASWADAVVIVARAGVTPLKALQRTKTILRQAHSRIAGVLLNDTSKGTGESNYYGKNYDGYYY
jgi:polysaccharide biosynthesis transport protein